jgi:hypothetical protein
MKDWTLWLAEQGLTKFLDSVGVYLGIITILISVSTWWMVRQQSLKLRRAAREIRPLGNYEEVFNTWAIIQTPNPYALAISLSPGQTSIENDVKTFLDITNTKVQEIKTLNLQGIAQPLEDTQKFIEKLRQYRSELSELGCSELLIFYQGPAIMAVQIGAVFDNWKAVKLFHKSTPATPRIYEYWGVITK